MSRPDGLSEPGSAGLSEPGSAGVSEPGSAANGREERALAPVELGARFAPDRRLLLILVVLAVLTRLVWVLWVHPPGNFVFSDMSKYVERAQELAEHLTARRGPPSLVAAATALVVWLVVGALPRGRLRRIGIALGLLSVIVAAWLLRTDVHAYGFEPDRTLAWQAWGTHHLLAIPLWIFGKDALWAGAVMWGLMGAAAVPAGYLLACRVSTRAWMPRVVGIALLLWHPSLSNSGYFLSEAPFLCFQLWSTYGLVVVLQDGRHALAAGVVSAVAFAVRPQSAMFFVLVLLTWVVARKRLPQVGVRQLLLVALPLLAMLGYSSLRFHAHTGQWLGVAENANMNLTAGRCHNIVTQAFANQTAKRSSERRNDTNDGRRVSLPAFRVLSQLLPPENPLALRPAMESDTLRFVGYIGDAEVHRRLRAECYRRTGTLEQIRYSFVNLSLSWFFGNQWPEQSRGAKYFRPPVEVFKYLYLGLVWLPSFVGMGAAVWWIRRRPGLAFCAWQLLNSMVVAAIFFGDIRLRTPYDPYAILLALEGWVLLAALRARWRARRAAGPATVPVGPTASAPASESGSEPPAAGSSAA
jgi:hypothetical protein